MPVGKITIEDIFDPSIKAFIEDLTRQIAKLTKELDGARSANADRSKSAENTNEVLQDSVEVTEDLLRLTQEEIVLKKNLAKTQEKLDKALEDGSVSADEYAIALKIGKEELSKMGFQLKNNTKLTLANRTSMTELSLQLAKNRMKYRDLTKAERDNDKIGVKLLKTIQKQDKEIKRLDKSIGNAQRNVGNYTKAMGKAARGSKKFGATLSALVIGTLVSTAKELQVVTDFMSTGVNVAVAAVGNMQKLASGEISFTEAFDLAGIYETAKALTLVSKQAQFLQALENQRYTDVRFQLEQQKVLREDEAAAFTDRINATRQINTLLDKSDKIIKDSFNERRKEFDEKLNADKNNIAAQTGLLNLTVEMNNKLRENEVQRREALRAEIGLRKELKGLYKEEDQLILERIILQETTDNLSLQNMRQNMEDRFTVRQDGLRAQLALEEKYSSQFWAIWLELQNNAVEHAQSMAELNSEISQRNFDIAVDVAQTGLSIASDIAGDNKDLQIATAIVNTFAGVTQALASAPPPYSFIQAALVLAAGLATVSKIQNTEVPSYAIGSDSIQGDQMALVHNRERILPSHINSQLGATIKNTEIPGLVNMGLKVPGLISGINQMVTEQRNTNRMMGRLKWVDALGKEHSISNNNIKFYN